ncbi:hypothetical protein [Cupriavidus basilensis]|uniref:hypothetical protein n=1 Tax=Cupriavidus basilensis TaxID=68895 RepID=UPI0020A6854D|nr:hypothetical protein [Cupriavidus basilensis]MCP3025225.1 hypothetical protein [Cupriavidus basilensis]
MFVAHRHVHPCKLIVLHGGLPQPIHAFTPSRFFAQEHAFAVEQRAKIPALAVSSRRDED